MNIETYNARNLKNISVDVGKLSSFFFHNNHLSIFFSNTFLFTLSLEYFCRYEKNVDYERFISFIDE